MKPRICVSFSGGETSSYMSYMIKKHYADTHELKFIFANTGEEREETLEFVQQCDEYFGLNVIWVEADVMPGMGNGTKAKVVDFNSASRNGEPFEEAIKKYGIPNQSFPLCSRVLKKEAIEAYQRQIKWRDRKKKPITAIGYRIDEAERASTNAKKDRLWYPLIDEWPTHKVEINKFWGEQPFRLNLKSWEGNCKWCWKKSFKKLAAIAVTNPKVFDFPRRMEEKYGNGRPQFEAPTTVRFFRENKSVDDIFELAKYVNPDSLADEKLIMPDTWKQMNLLDLDFGGCEESCSGF
jgi:predicted phosphoadenosine phosphosulfate sulfurtransferase